MHQTLYSICARGHFLFADIGSYKHNDMGSRSKCVRRDICAKDSLVVTVDQR